MMKDFGPVIDSQEDLVRLPLFHIHFNFYLLIVNSSKVKLGQKLYYPRLSGIGQILNSTGNENSLKLTGEVSNNYDNQTYYFENGFVPKDIKIKVLEEGEFAAYLLYFIL